MESTRMKLLIFLVGSVALSLGDRDADFMETPKEKTLSDINKEALLSNDIKEDTLSSSVNVESSLWKMPIPYTLANGLELNAKGVILRAFDQFRQKSCIDFKPRDSEYYYVLIQKLDGCYSYVGRWTTEQPVSIGTYCDWIDIVEHELLHAIGFYHEQSRYDRDDYVTIKFQNVLAGYESNFFKEPKTETTTMGVPYDYYSVMHYGQYDFSKNNNATIVTNNPKFQEVIGKSPHMSGLDVRELNRRYNCSSSTAFRLHCSFSGRKMCGMNHCSKNGKGWELVTHAKGGPKVDHTSLPDGYWEKGEDLGYFMHASTAYGKEGYTAWLETPRMMPKRQCNVQCLQFYYYHSGHESDVLNIWIREFEDEDDHDGTRRIAEQITGPNTEYWKFHQVSLDASKHFQVEFEARNGRGKSTGGFSIDDINLSEVECPHAIIQIDNFESAVRKSSDVEVVTPRLYTPDGYAHRFIVRMNKTYIGLQIQMVSGENDDWLQWPCLNRQATLEIRDQTSNYQQHMSMEFSVTSAADQLNKKGISPWQNPKINGTEYIDENNKTSYAGIKYGIQEYATLEELFLRTYIKGESALFTFSFHDLTPLINTSVLPCPKLVPVNITHPPMELDNGPCAPRVRGNPPPPPTATQKPDPPKTTSDDSVFGFSPATVASPLLTILLALMQVLQ